MADDEYDATSGGEIPGAPNNPLPEKPEILASEWESRILKAKAHYSKTFKRMRKNQQLARVGATKEWAESGKYTVPILARYINQAVSVLYARNPTTVVKRKHRMMFRLWDGRLDTLKAALQGAQMGDENAMAIVNEVLQMQKLNLLYDRMGQTLSHLWDYYLNEQSSNYKVQLKALVRRTKVCKVGYIKLGYQRVLEKRPDVDAQINDITSKIANIQVTLKDMQNEEPDDAELEELQYNLADLQNDRYMVVREGPVLSFPRADQIIVDPGCLHLKTFTGARWVAEEFEMTPKEILQTYDVDIGEEFKWYSSDGNPYDKSPDECSARVYEVYDKENLQMFTICEGHKGFLKEPATPDVWMERFWPYFPLVFNECEDDKEIFPQSDIEHAEHIQNEYNRSREARRQHRIAARPYYVTAQGLDKDEKEKLAFHEDHAVIVMPSLAAGQKVEDLIQRGPTAPIDPNIYEVETVFQDLLRSVGVQEANLGGTGGATATENSIAEQSRTASQSDNVDDLDEVLTDLARAAGQVMLTNVSKQTALEIVGPGAVWPETPETAEEASKELYLEIEAGSSGRPNRAAELANMERAMPYVLQIPGINPLPVGRKYLQLLDVDVEEALAEGMPSITAINAAMAKAAQAGPPNAGANPTGDPATDPNSQGAEGAQNAPSPQANEPGPQPAYPSPAPIG